MKKEYLQQFEELNEEELSELIDDLTCMWSKKHNGPSAEEMESNEGEEDNYKNEDEDIEYKVEEDLELERDNNFIIDNIL